MFKFFIFFLSNEGGIRIVTLYFVTVLLAKLIPESFNKETSLESDRGFSPSPSISFLFYF